jgi:hypothetical protein
MMVEITRDVGDEVAQCFSFVIARDFVVYVVEEALNGIGSWAIRREPEPEGRPSLLLLRSLPVSTSSSGKRRPHRPKSGSKTTSQQSLWANDVALAAEQPASAITDAAAVSAASVSEFGFAHKHSD